MKKSKLLTAALLISTYSLMTACNKYTDAKATPTTASPTMESTTISSTEDTIADTTANKEKLPNLDNLKDKLRNFASQIGISEITDAYYDNIKKIDSDTIFLDVVLTTNLYKVKCNCSYSDFTDSWKILSAENNETNHTYYILPGNEDSVDLYDYATDDLISKKKENLEKKDVVKEFNESMESINEDYDAKLNSIADKYNSKK
jgi:hypothetical protein